MKGGLCFSSSAMLPAGSAFTGQGPELFFAVTSKSEPSLVIDDGPSGIWAPSHLSSIRHDRENDMGRMLGAYVNAVGSHYPTSLIIVVPACIQVTLKFWKTAR
jgi:hypothetical protein